MLELNTSMGTMRFVIFARRLSETSYALVAALGKFEIKIGDITAVRHMDDVNLHYEFGSVRKCYTSIDEIIRAAEGYIVLELLSSIKANAIAQTTTLSPEKFYSKSSLLRPASTGKQFSELFFKDNQNDRQHCCSRCQSDGVDCDRH